MGFVHINVTGRTHLRDAVASRANATETMATGADRLTDAAWKNLHAALDSGKIKTDLDPVQSSVEIRTETLDRMKKIASRILDKPVDGITNIQALDIVVQVANLEESA